MNPMRYNRIKKSPRTDCGRASVLYTSEGCGEAEAFLGNAKRVFPVCHVTAAQRQCRFFWEVFTLERWIIWMLSFFWKPGCLLFEVYFRNSLQDPRGITTAFDATLLAPFDAFQCSCFLKLCWNMTAKKVVNSTNQIPKKRNLGCQTASIANSTLLF